MTTWAQARRADEVGEEAFRDALAHLDNAIERMNEVRWFQPTLENRQKLERVRHEVAGALASYSRASVHKAATGDQSFERPKRRKR